MLAALSRRILTPLLLSACVLFRSFISSLCVTFCLLFSSAVHQILFYFLFFSFSFRRVTCATECVRCSSYLSISLCAMQACALLCRSDLHSPLALNFMFPFTFFFLLFFFNVIHTLLLTRLHIAFTDAFTHLIE
jgi:hypothetical protein